MGNSMRGTMADIACHIMKAVLLIGFAILLVVEQLNLKLVMDNKLLTEVIRVVAVGILTLTAILGRNEMSMGGKKAANSCLYWGCCYHAMAYAAPLVSDASWGQLSVCGLIEMGLIMLVYVLCSGDALWTVLLYMLAGVGIVFSGHGMLLAGWNGWLIAGVLIAETIVLWFLIQAIDQWIMENMCYDTWTKEDRTGGYILTGVCLTVLVVMICGVFVPGSRNMSITHSDTAYYNGGEKSATLYHVDYGSKEDWKLPAYIMQFVQDNDCREYLIVTNAEPLLDFGIGKVYNTKSFKLETHSVLHHVSDMQLVWISWQDANTLSVDGVTYTIK